MLLHNSYEFMEMFFMERCVSTCVCSVMTTVTSRKSFYRNVSNKFSKKEIHQKENLTDHKQSEQRVTSEMERLLASSSKNFGTVYCRIKF